MEDGIGPRGSRTAVWLPALRRRCLFRLAKQFISDHPERDCGVDDRRPGWDVGAGGVQREDEVALGRLGAKLVLGTFVQSPPQGVGIDVQDEHTVEDVEELCEVPGAAAEEREPMRVIGRDRADPIHRPEVLLVGRCACGWPASDRVPLISQVGVAVQP